MNLLRLTTELKNECKQEELEAYFTDWLNDTVLELAGEFELPDLKTSSDISTDISHWLYNMPDNYHKKPYMLRSSGGELRIGRQIAFIDSFDPDHTITGSSVSYAAIEGTQLAVYPMASDTLTVWYYRVPTDMANSTDVPDGIPEAFHENVVLARTMVKNSEAMQDMTLQHPPEYWVNKYKEGIAMMIDYFTKTRRL